MYVGYYHYIYRVCGKHSGNLDLIINVLRAFHLPPSGQGFWIDVVRFNANLTCSNVTQFSQIPWSKPFPIPRITFNVISIVSLQYYRLVNSIQLSIYSIICLKCYEHLRIILNIILQYNINVRSLSFWLKCFELILLRLFCLTENLC